MQDLEDSYTSYIGQRSGTAGQKVWFEPYLKQKKLLTLTENPSDQ